MIGIPRSLTRPPDLAWGHVTDVWRYYIHREFWPTISSEVSTVDHALAIVTDPDRSTP